MADSALREVERRWRASRSQADEEALLSLRLRLGLVTAPALRVAAVAGNAAAAAVSGAAPSETLHLREDERTTRDAFWTGLGMSACVAVGLALARRVEPAWLEHEPQLRSKRDRGRGRACLEAAAACVEAQSKERRQVAARAALDADRLLRRLGRTQPPYGAWHALAAAHRAATLASLLLGNAPGQVREVAAHAAAALAGDEVADASAVRAEVDRVVRAALVAWALGADHAP